MVLISGNLIRKIHISRRCQYKIKRNIELKKLRDTISLLFVNFSGRKNLLIVVNVDWIKKMV